VSETSQAVRTLGGMAKKYRDVKLALRKAGWKPMRTAGSHEVWTHRDGRMIVVPGGGKNSFDVPTGTLASIRSKTGLRNLR
jgi:predicted RNA binding protein YcfA (HicA-like mRNA interferase family)